MELEVPSWWHKKEYTVQILQILAKNILNFYLLHIFHFFVSKTWNRNRDWDDKA